MASSAALYLMSKIPAITTTIISVIAEATNEDNRWKYPTTEILW